jgi:hypothetical protein
MGRVERESCPRGIQTGSDDARQKSGKPTAQDHARHRSIEKGSSLADLTWRTESVCPAFLCSFSRSQGIKTGMESGVL